MDFEPFASLSQVTEGIQQRPVGPGVQQPTVVMLAMNLDQQFADPGDVEREGLVVGHQSAAGFPTSGSFRIRIEEELLEVTAGQGTTTWTVMRGT